MLPSLRFGKIFGIETTVHWSFWILLAWVLLDAGLSFGLQAGIHSVVFLLTIFFCVYLHEFGHAYAAARYGIRTIDITMLPIGGLARLERMPRDAKQELVIALAGPAVNIAIAIVLGLSLFSMAEMSHLHEKSPLDQSFIAQVLIVNVGLAVFNMIPAFPMDGGRVLRGLLQLRYSRLTATEIAVRVSRYLAIMMIILGLFKGITLSLVGIFVLISGFQELMSVRMQAMRESGQSPFGQWNTSNGTTTWVWSTQFGGPKGGSGPYPSEFSEDGRPNRFELDDGIIDANDVKRIE